METKMCPVCGRELPLSNFYAKAKSKDGYQTYCIDCSKDYAKKRKATAKASNEHTHERAKTIDGSYNLNNWERDIILSCVKENPMKTFSDICNMLGIHEIVAYRKINAYNIAKEFAEKEIEGFSKIKLKEACENMNLSKAKNLKDYSDKEILLELKSRGYEGSLIKTTRSEINLNRMFKKN